MASESSGSIVRYWPVIVGIGSIGCVCYAGGYFHYAGTEWMTFLSLSDFLSLVWPAVATQAVTMLIGVWAWIFDPPWEAKGQSTDNPATSTSRPQKTTQRLSILLAVVLVCAWVWGRSALSPADSFFLVLMLVPLIGLMPQISLRSGHHHTLSSGVAGGAFVLLAFCYSVGQWQGGGPFRQAANAQVALSDGSTRCVSIIALTTRGAIYTGDRRTSSYSDWQRVSSINIGRTVCKTAVGAHVPK
jgi:hypothetical protein